MSVLSSQYVVSQWIKSPSLHPKTSADKYDADVALQRGGQGLVPGRPRRPPRGRGAGWRPVRGGGRGQLGIRATAFNHSK